MIIGCSTESRKDSKIKFEDLEGVWYAVDKNELKELYEFPMCEYFAVTKDSITTGSVDAGFELDKLIIEGDYYNYYGYGSFNYENQSFTIIDTLESPKKLVTWEVKEKSIKENETGLDYDTSIVEYAIDSLVNDSLYITPKPILYLLRDSLVYSEKMEKFWYDFTPYFKLPKYSSAEARLKLMSYREDLELQLITQKQYDSIKNELKKYIK